MVYKIKRMSDESIEQYKARWVILENSQVEGLDYNEIFSPIAKMVTVINLSVATARR